ncbi:C39 family peptidase [Patescibacteria group bacterium AH-259-L05]|nr:C39 family peptidase [Patescibacteria group bacterium AH-259-L05]
MGTWLIVSRANNKVLRSTVLIAQEKSEIVPLETLEPEVIVQPSSQVEVEHTDDSELINTPVGPETKDDSPVESPITPQSQDEVITADSFLSEAVLKQDFSKQVLLDVPFTSQAPRAQWNDPIFQNGCEETSILMAMSWVRGASSLPVEEAEKEIRAISSLAQEMYGHFHDISASDTAQLVRDYFNYSNIEARLDISAEDIKEELVKGNVVIVPVNGQKLNNPYYTPPGPLEHMLVVIGHNPETNEFITNDPGTRRGEKFRYPEDILEAALQDYPTGYHEPINEVNKTMIVIKPRL